MRILLVSPMVPRENGPGAIPSLLYAEVVGLRERHEVTVVTAIGDEAGEEEAARTLRKEGLDLHLADRRRPPPGLGRTRRQLRLASSWLRGTWPWSTVWFAAPGIQAAIDRLVAHRSFDLIAVEFSAMGVFRLPPAPAVLTEHEVVNPAELRQAAAGVPGWPRWALRELDRRRWPAFQSNIWRRFDRVQVFTELDASAVTRLAPEIAARVRVNPFGLVLPQPADPRRERPGTVLFLGNFTHPPNRDAALWLAREIMPHLRSHHPGALLRIAGAFPTREVLELAQADVEVVPDPLDVRPHLAEACVVLAPVRIGGGMRMKVLYGLASGKPVVTTPLGTEGFASLASFLPLVVAEDAESIALATARLLREERERRDLSRRARSYAEKHHSPAAWASRLEAVYEEARAVPLR
jgi:glycosyltransferase involved in cell wall biosynthesis